MHDLFSVHPPVFSLSYATLDTLTDSTHIDEQWLAICEKQLDITPQLEFTTDILAIIPFIQNENIRTFVLFQDKVQLIDCSSFLVINHWLNSFNLDYAHYYDLYMSFHSQKIYGAPVSNGAYSLFPLENIHNPTTPWLNAGQIAELERLATCTKITFQNGLSYNVNKQITSLELQIKRALYYHLLFKPIQQISMHSLTYPTNLLEYLKLPSTTVTRKLARLVPFSLDSHKENEFRLSYFGMTQEYQHFLEQKQTKRETYD